MVYFASIWNKYNHGTGSAFVELGSGINYILTDKFGFYLQAGVLATQQAFLIPVRIGIRF